MLWHAGLTRSTGAGGDDQERRRHPSTAADARAGLPATGSGLIALDLARDHLAASAGTWFEQVTPIARFYDLVITDWGVRHQQVDLDRWPEPAMSCAWLPGPTGTRPRRQPLCCLRSQESKIGPGSCSRWSTLVERRKVRLSCSVISFRCRS